MTASGLSELVDVALYRTLAWLDEELEPYPIPQGVLTRVRFPYRVLSDIEPEKRETRFTLQRVACVSGCGSCWVSIPVPCSVAIRQALPDTVR